MANGKTYGINFPFQDSLQGKYLSLSEDANREIRSNLIHLILFLSLWIPLRSNQSNRISKIM